MIRCKFVITSKTKFMGYDQDLKVPAPHYHIEGRAVYDNGNAENRSFFQGTPSGEIKLGILNKKAADYIEPGDEVYITIEKVPPAK